MNYTFIGRIGYCIELQGSQAILKNNQEVIK